MTGEVRLDCLGQLCPLPIIELARRIADVSIGEVIAVVSDDPAAATDVPAWCRMRGQEYAGTRAEPLGVAYLVRRSS